MRLIAPSLAALALSASLGAVPIPGDLSFVGHFQVDEDGGDSIEVAGGATQSGSIFARESGADTATTFSDATVIGANPLMGTLLEHGGGIVGAGDGFGGTATGTASALLFFQAFFADTDLGDGETMPLTVTNSSATDYFRVFFSLTFTHSVLATGFDAFADSDLEVEVDGMEIFESKLVSDTFFGNEIDGSPVPGFGGPLAASGPFFFEIIVTPNGGFREVTLDHTMEGIACDCFGPGSNATINAQYFLSVDDISNLGAVPEPSGYVLIGSGLLMLAALRRRRGAA